MAVTDGLVEQFGCIFARLWVINKARTALKLVASSGLHTQLNGSFSTVPMGSFKVGKIAQQGMPFLSNRLAEETWVKDKDWAVRHSIQGFAGLPLAYSEEVVGVLAVFSQTPLSAEFLEVLQVMSIAIAGAIATAQMHQSVIMRQQSSLAQAPLSEQLGQILGRQKISLIGLEQPLSEKGSQVVVELAQQFRPIAESYCRLVYDRSEVRLEIICSPDAKSLAAIQPALDHLCRQADDFGGKLAVERNRKIVRAVLEIPRQPMASELSSREQEVLNLLAQGLRDRDIAGQLYISERTVKFHVKNILTKLNVRTRVQAVFNATRCGWLT